MSWTTEKFYTTASEIKDYLGLSEEEEKQMQVILEHFPNVCSGILPLPDQ